MGALNFLLLTDGLRSWQADLPVQHGKCQRLPGCPHVQVANDVRRCIETQEGLLEISYMFLDFLQRLLRLIASSFANSSTTSLTNSQVACVLPWVLQVAPVRGCRLSRVICFQHSAISLPHLSQAHCCYWLGLSSYTRLGVMQVSDIFCSLCWQC